MRSASEMVCSRCATVSTVHSRKALLTVACCMTSKAVSQKGCFMAHGTTRQGASISRETDSTEGRRVVTCMRASDVESTLEVASSCNASHHVKTVLSSQRLLTAQYDIRANKCIQE